MSIGEQIAPHVPYLRRFARALTGSQRVGDAYVAALLEALVEDPGAFPECSSPKVALYKIFCSLWPTFDIDAGRDESDGAWELAANERLAALDSAVRQAFLLRTVEGFSLAEVCEILDLSEAEATGLIDQVGREIADMMATDVLIIEDEPIISMDLENLVGELGHRVSGVARTHKQAVQSVSSERPGLVLADIQLADGSSGLTAVNEILRSIEVPVIFITAFPERFLSGDRPEPAFLITKPFQEEQVKAMISQALFFDASARAV